MGSLQIILGATVAVLAALYVVDCRSMRSVSLRQANSSLEEISKINQQLFTDNLKALTNYVNGTSLTNFTQATQAGTTLWATTVNNTSEAIAKGANVFSKAINRFFSWFG